MVMDEKRTTGANQCRWFATLQLRKHAVVLPQLQHDHVTHG